MTLRRLIIIDATLSSKNSRKLHCFPTCIRTLTRQNLAFGNVLAYTYFMLTKRQKQGLVKDYQKHETDTGSAEVQIALLTRQIKALAGHLKKNPKDHHSRRGLLMMVGKRRKFLQYLKRENEKSYEKVTKKLELE